MDVPEVAKLTAYSQTGLDDSRPVHGISLIQETRILQQFLLHALCPQGSHASSLVPASSSAAQED